MRAQSRTLRRAQPSRATHTYAVRYAPPSHTAHACAIRSTAPRLGVTRRASIRPTGPHTIPPCHAPRIRTLHGDVPTTLSVLSCACARGPEHTSTFYRRAPRIRTRSGTPQHALSSRTAYPYVVRPAAPRPAVTRRASIRAPRRHSAPQCHAPRMRTRSGTLRRHTPRTHTRYGTLTSLATMRMARARSDGEHARAIQCRSYATITQRSRDDHAAFCGGRSATRFGSLPIGPAACAPPRSPTSAKNSIAASLYHSHCAGRSSS